MIPHSRSSAQMLQAGALLSLCLGFSACRPQDPPIQYSLTVPEPNQVRLEVELAKRYGLGLTGQFDIFNYGSIFLQGESASRNFGFGFELNTGVFLRDTWVNYREVTALPTGALFPVWLRGPVVDVKIPALDREQLGWDFYFGTRGQFYVGVAASIGALRGNVPSINIEYSFYDSQGRVVLGLQFYGPEVGGQGRPGGIFIGTNITPFLPAEALPVLPRSPSETTGNSSEFGVQSAIQPLIAQPILKKGALLNQKPELRRPDLAPVLQLAQAVAQGKQIHLNGQSLVSEVRVQGRDAGRIRSDRDLQRALNAFLIHSQNR